MCRVCLGRACEWSDVSCVCLGRACERSDVSCVCLGRACEWSDVGDSWLCHVWPWWMHTVQHNITTFNDSTDDCRAVRICLSRCHASQVSVSVCLSRCHASQVSVSVYQDAMPHRSQSLSVCHDATPHRSQSLSVCHDATPHRSQSLSVYHDATPHRSQSLFVYLNSCPCSSVNSRCRHDVLESSNWPSVVCYTWLAWRDISVLSGGSSVKLTTNNRHLKRNWWRSFQDQRSEVKVPAKWSVLSGRQMAVDLWRFMLCAYDRDIEINIVALRFTGFTIITARTVMTMIVL